MFLIFKNTVIKLKFEYTFTRFVNLYKLSLSKQQHSCKIFLSRYFWKDVNNYQQETTPVFFSSPEPKGQGDLL